MRFYFIQYKKISKKNFKKKFAPICTSAHKSARIQNFFLKYKQELLNLSRIELPKFQNDIYFTSFIVIIESLFIIYTSNAKLRFSGPNFIKLHNQKNNKDEKIFTNPISDDCVDRMLSAFGEDFHNQSLRPQRGLRDKPGQFVAHAI